MRNRPAGRCRVLQPGCADRAPVDAAVSTCRYRSDGRAQYRSIGDGGRYDEPRPGTTVFTVGGATGTNRAQLEAAGTAAPCQRFIVVAILHRTGVSALGCGRGAGHDGRSRPADASGRVGGDAQSASTGALQRHRTAGDSAAGAPMATRPAGGVTSARPLGRAYHRPRRQCCPADGRLRRDGIRPVRASPPSPWPPARHRSRRRPTGRPVSPSAARRSPT